jgi:ABC-2 type transport system ATP-binding protein
LTDLRHLGHTHVVATFTDGRVATAALDPSEVSAWVAARPGLAGLTATPPTLEELFLARYESEAPTR